jgi:hypothetical protein
VRRGREGDGKREGGREGEMGRGREGGRDGKKEGGRERERWEKVGVDKGGCRKM